MKREQFYYHGTDGTKINAYRWDPEKKSTVQGVVQLSHGMAEHVLRYEHFCKFLTEHNFIVYGNDHRGHGKTIVGTDDKGFFAEKNGFEKVVSDMKQLSDIIHQEKPHIPLFIFGHSMGSFLTRRYIQLFSNDIKGVILSGTGGDKGLLGKAGILLAKLERKIKGARTSSPLMNSLIFGGFNKEFNPTRTDFDFLTRDKHVVDEYINDPNCGFICSSGFYTDLLRGIEQIHREKELEKTDKSLPIFLISGSKDPVGGNGKEVEEVYELYQRHGYKDVSFKLYENARHELLNELNKEEVFEDILRWLQAVLKGRYQ